MENNENKNVYCITNSKLLNMHQRFYSLTNDCLIGLIHGLLYYSTTENRTTIININYNINLIGFIQYCLLFQIFQWPVKPYVFICWLVSVENVLKI